MKGQLRAAFEAVAAGYSPDRVIADPELNARFLEQCRARGLVDSDAALNRALMNLRKGGQLRGLKSRASSFSDDSECRFAAEMAARFLERRDSLSLDEILCDPRIADEFDCLATQLAPGFAPVQYRWAALKLRKTKQLQPEILSRVIQATTVSTSRAAVLDIGAVPAVAGLYVFFAKAGALYVGEAENLQVRLRKHLDHSDNKGLARWLWDQGSDGLHLELHVLPPNVSTRVRRALELEMIRSRRPLFNVKR